MRRLFFVLLMMLGGFSQLWAQAFPDPYRYPEDRSVTGGIGMTWINDQPYTTLTIAPDLAFGKFGVGLNIQLLFKNNDGFKFRKDEYKGGAGIFRVIRYLRYGQKYDPYYFRIGSLDRATLGNGFLMWNYNNQSNYDKRKIGLVGDVDLNQFGFESVFSSFGTSELQGGNIYVRPFRFAEEPLPILRNLRIYGTYLQDSKVHDEAINDSTFSEKKLSAYGFGVDLQWLNIKILRSTIYADYSKFSDFGSGKVVGINAVFPDFIGLFAVSARLEKRFIGEQFIPSLFGPLYDLQRELGGANSVFTRLRNAPKTEGIFGELAGHIVHRVHLIGSFQKLNGIRNSGVLHLEANAPDLVPRFELRAYYDKANIETFRDARTLDINSVLTADVGYELNNYLLLSVIYRWYWVEQTDNPGVYKPVERVEPRLSFRYNF
jgi:hypothetical protein